MRSGERTARGFTYVWMLAALVIFSIGLAVVGPLWADQAKREREQDLLRVGQLYAQAIASYYAASPGSLKQYPPALASLLADTRFVGTRRHLRTLYPDPLEPTREWGLVTGPDGSVRGVYSQSADVPLHNAALDLDVTSLPAAQHYAEWKFAPKVR